MQSQVAMVGNNRRLSSHHTTVSTEYMLAIVLEVSTTSHEMKKTESSDNLKCCNIV